MAERRGLFTEEAQGTVLAVCFVLALLATGFGVYDLVQLRGLTAIVALHNVNAENVNAQFTALGKRLEDVERRLAEVEKRSAEVATAAATPPAEPAAPAPGGKAGKGKAP